MILLRALMLLAGLVLIVNVLLSAIRTVVVPRGITDRLTRSIFTCIRYLFDIPIRWRDEEAQERILAYFAPVTLLMLPVVWLGLLLLAYTCIFWALGNQGWEAAFTSSRLSLLYLGANIRGQALETTFAFSETVFSLMLAAVLISYLPTMYSAFSQREVAVTGLETRAGSPPSAVTMIVRYHLIHGLDHIGDVWRTWQQWFQLVEESHTALQALVHYRSPQPGRSWVTAAGAVMDAAALTASTVDREHDAEADLCIRAGYLCLRRIAESFQIPFKEDPQPGDPISIRREEFDQAYDAMAARGVPLTPDREQAWRDFAGWRVNYDAVLVSLAVLTMAPSAPWSSDRVRHQGRMLGSALQRARAVALAVARGDLPTTSR